jgi:hypothetical protein
MYFNNFPEIQYPFKISKRESIRIVRDITQNVRFRKEVLENVTLYDDYYIKDGETPEIISAKYYGDSRYHWVIMLVNQKYDYIEDFPRPQRILEEYIFEKYEDPYEVKHYENSEGYIVDDTYTGASEITYYDYEQSLNDSKRKIRLISPELLSKVLKEFKDLI